MWSYDVTRLNGARFSLRYHSKYVQCVVANITRFYLNINKCKSSDIIWRFLQLQCFVQCDPVARGWRFFGCTQYLSKFCYAVTVLSFGGIHFQLLLKKQHFSTNRVESHTIDPQETCHTSTGSVRGLWKVSARWQNNSISFYSNLSNQHLGTWA